MLNVQLDYNHLEAAVHHSFVISPIFPRLLGEHPSPKLQKYP